MSTTDRRGAGSAGTASPDPSEFAATLTPVSPPTWPAAAVEAAADTGVLVAGRERLLAGFGVAAALPLPCGLEDLDALLSAQEWLAAVQCETRAGTDGPSSAPPSVVALGAFPFDRSATASLLVPSVTFCKDVDGRTWRVDVRRRGRDDRDDAATEAFGSPRGSHDAESGRPEISQVPPPSGYVGAVASAVSDIRAGKLHKVVLGRMVEVTLPVPVAASAVLRTLWATEGVFSPFSVPTPAGRLVGASAELLVGRRGTAVTSHAFAGTVPLSASDADADAERLAGSAKDRSEHRLVVDEIVAVLGPRCASLTVPAAPTVVRLRSDARLGTLISGTLAIDAPGDGALALLSQLHPTPAVGGVPRGVALERIAALEAAPRGYWAGAVGWTDGAGDGEWVLAIRSVELDHVHARVRSGAGIVEDSVPELELAETTVKLRPVLDALWPGTSSLL